MPLKGVRELQKDLKAKEKEISDIKYCVSEVSKKNPKSLQEAEQIFLQTAIKKGINSKTRSEALKELKACFQFSSVLPRNY